MTSVVFLSPALPSELLSYILNQHAHPTTLIICSTKAEFLASIVEDIQNQSRSQHKNSRKTQDTTDHQQAAPRQDEPPHAAQEEEEDTEEVKAKATKHALLSSPLYQVATSRHIRVVYIPTVTHLRAYLSVFSPDDSRVPAPPSLPAPTRAQASPTLTVYGFLQLHRDTSEWSAQGLSDTLSALVERASRLSWKATLIEPRVVSCSDDGGSLGLEELLREAVPILNGGVRRLGLGADPNEGGGWSGRTVEVGRVLGRWTRFQKAQWDACQ
ncbi:hypothetical protein F4777DRAFT_248873 [Nemania sp. FL0916]|nr:hypothetical protein F4777DRAFT_248873 [Nemania sp. FL0916]